MAARRLQKLQGDDLTRAAQQSGSSEEDDSPGPAPYNAFELLGGDEEEEEPPQEEVVPQEPTTASPSSDPSAIALKAPTVGKKAKRKHKKASKASPEPKPVPEEQAAGSGTEDIDAILKELGIEQSQTPLDRAQPGSRRQDGVDYDPLAVDPHKLKPDAELKRIFGARTIREAQREEPSGPGLQGASRKIKRLAARGLIKAELPAQTDGDGYRIRYYHDLQYHTAQQDFERAQSSYDPNQIMQVLQWHPYHVDSLLAIAELQRAMGKHEEADFMIQRAVYALEMAWPSRCNPAAGMHITISYDEEINRPMFRALFLHAQGLSRRGLHATALEVSKLLMGLDQRDPCGVIFCINYYALRAHDYTFVQRLARQDTSCPLDLAIPGNAYSYSMAKLLQQRTASAASASTSASAAGSQRGVHAEGPDAETADGQLTRAILLYPLIVAQLIPKLQEQGAAKDAEWASIMGMPLFAQASDEGSASLGHLTALYVERHHSLWKNAEVLAWLRRNCRAAADMVAEHRDMNITVSASVQCPGTEETEHEPLQMAALRKLLFPPGPNAYSHLKIHDFSDSVNALPPEELNEMFGAGQGGGRQQVEVRLREDLIPAQLMEQLRPLLEHGGQLDPELYQELRELEAAGRAELDRQHAHPAPVWADVRQQQQQQQRQQPANNILPAVRPVDQESLRRMHPLVAILRAFLPWHDAGQQPDYGAVHATDQGQDQPQDAEPAPHEH